MKYAPLIVVLLTSISLNSCMSRRAVPGGGTGASMKSVTINQPDLKKEMLSSFSEADKQKVFDSLVYSVEIKAVQKDGKDDCDKDVTATKFDSGVNPMSKSSFDTVKVKRGCNYIVSMKIGEKSADGASIKTLYLSSWDDQKPSILTKEELEKAKPTAKVSLYVTTEGKKYWDADEIVTPVDSDAAIEATLSKTFLVTSSITDRSTKGLFVVMKMEVTPKAPAQVDMFCSTTIRLMTRTFDDKGDEVYSYKYLLPLGESSPTLKFAANSATKQTISEMTTYIEIDRSTVVVETPIALCSDSQRAALDLLKKCAAATGPSDPAVSTICPVSM